MRTIEQTEAFAERIRDLYPEDQAEYYTACYDACIPKTFWDSSTSQIYHNKAVFDEIVLTYLKRWRKARKHGYGLLFVGDNGSGKSIAISILLTQLLKRGLSVYYTSLAQLDLDIKRSFQNPAYDKRLAEQLDCDFVAIDEIGKEYIKDNSYLHTRLELLLKTRYDEGDPTICASNMDFESLKKLYGSSIASVWDGKYQLVMLESGDARGRHADQMHKDMFGKKVKK